MLSARGRPSGGGQGLGLRVRLSVFRVQRALGLVVL